jgi:glucose-6-phosphate isomerase
MSDGFNFDLGSFQLSMPRLWEHPEGPRLTSDLERRLVDGDIAVRAKYRSGAVGFYDWPLTQTETEKAEIRETAARLRKQFEGALIFGIGGSHLGPAAVLQALRTRDEEADFPIHWVSNVDPAAIHSAEALVKKRKMAALIVSKSGGTAETLAGFFHFSKHLDPKGYVAVTDPSAGWLRRTAEKEGWGALPVPPAIGGRFSVLTAVGLLPVELAKLSSERLLAGARAVREKLEKCAPKENPAYLLAAAFHHWDFKHRNIHYLMPYWSNLALMADWFVQLWGESLGKRVLRDPQKAVGFTPVGALGTTDQHSLLQLMKEGPLDKVVGFLDVSPEADPVQVAAPRFDPGDQKFLVGQSFARVSRLASNATEKSINNSGVPTYRLELPRVDEAALGGLFFFYETACAFAGELYGVDAFNQPGVEEAKRLLRQSL